MAKVLGVFILSILVGACSSDRQEGFASKTSTNVGLSCQKDDTLTAKAIYGSDNRQDWFSAPGQTKDYWAKATLALMGRGSMVKDGEEYVVASTSYEDMVGLCPGSRFGKQPSAAYCSGFLVAPDLVVTAGHCIRSTTHCRSIDFVFDFAKTEIDQSEYRIPSSSVYACSEVISRSTGATDFAVVRLDRPVTDRVPLNLRRQGTLTVGEQLMLIGHPMGIPSKIADGGFASSVGDTIFATVDAFAANSGSVVLNSKTGLVEGILVAGEVDFEYENGCKIEKNCGDECSGEVITPISKLLSVIPAVDYSNPLCE